MASNSSHPEEDGKNRRSIDIPLHFCREHAEEKLKMFCLECQQPACMVCQFSIKHVNHISRFRPINETVPEHKEEVQELLKPLQEKLKAFNEVKSNYDKTAEHIKVRAQHTEMQIKQQFNKMHQFLHDEEEAKINALREEEQQKSQMMKEKIDCLNRDISNISDTIAAIEEELRADNISFLQNYKTTVERVQLTAQLDPPPLSGGTLIDEAKHLKNLTFKVWDKMKDIVSYTHVLLDPNTAHPNLILSDDLTSARWGDAQQLPDNLERFDWWGRVLGSKSYNSGTRSWDVEVGDNANWTLGVLGESFQKKGNRKIVGKRWCIQFDGGEYRGSYSSGSGSMILTLKQRPKKIRVQLDWNKGTLSFCDLDTNIDIHTIAHTFTDGLFPYIGTNQAPPLKMLPWKVGVNICKTT